MMNASQLVRELNAAANVAGTARSIVQFDNIGTQSQYRVPYAITARYVTPGMNVLDWGCGNGHFSLLLERLGAHITGYSFEEPPACMSSSSRFHYVRGSESDPRTIPFPDASFDAACSVGVLEHVVETGGDERASLAEIVRVLKPGGVFLTFHLPNRGGWIESLARRIQPGKYVHPRRYVEREIRSLWSDAGLSIERVGRYNILPRAELQLLPRAIRYNRAFIATYNAADDAVSTIARRFCTNYFVVGRKQRRTA